MRVFTLSSAYKIISIRNNWKASGKGLVTRMPGTYYGHDLLRGLGLSVKGTKGQALMLLANIHTQLCPHNETSIKT